MDKFHSFLRGRRSIRRFLPKPVSERTIQRILKTAIYAPSAHNQQPWRFAVVTTLDMKARLAQAMSSAFRRDLEADGMSPEDIDAHIGKSRQRLVSTPLAIVLCMDGSGMDVYPDPVRKKAEYIMTVQSVAAAGLQLLLAVHAEGLAGVWTCSPLFAPEVIKTELGLPTTWEPQVMFFIGYPDEKPKRKIVNSLERIVLRR